ncbi:neuroligin-4, X-linked isoform X3 [Aphidius gifuensis]|uniref:neuroligin-4, X-linked isoform X3 n=1 Tax=Aphidius gifuensis TaxID=684658 RepID=UPI001CDD7929|nr:neuroligin-4, X-linked isoform X3 [Aphidius gifuensis]
MDTRTVHAFNGRVTIFLLLFLNVIFIVNTQDSFIDDSRKYNRGGVYVPPGETGHQTYVYKDRRYGYQSTNYLDPIYRGGPDHKPQDRNKFNQDEQESVYSAPGILGKWREDLQGKYRDDSKNWETKRNVFVTTNYGQVQGFKVQLYDNPEDAHKPWRSAAEKSLANVDVFLGIRYASPPTHNGRFKPPIPPSPWQLMQAVDWGPACPQPSNYTGATKGVRDVDEDCLYLNVFSPNVESSVAKLYPVMFYIHGGEFIHGASNLFPGHMLAGFYQVIVVTFNYRLGVLGFLSTADESSPGNYGILDQAMALQWVYNNIQNFNGDPNDITLFGPGSGAASAGLLMVAPKTRHMVAKVIAQSGSALADWALIIDKYRVQNTSRVYASNLGCNIESNFKLFKCISSRGPYELGNSELKPNIGMFPWAPVLDVDFKVPSDNWYDGWRASDWHFLDETPEQSIKAGRFRPDIKYMAGVTTQEASYILANNETLRKDGYKFNETMLKQKIWEMVLRYNYTLNPLGVYEAIKYMYTHWPDPNNETLIRDEYINLLSDFLFVAPFDKIAKLLIEKKIPVYLYVLNTTVETLNLPHWNRVPHDTEYLWLTGAPFMDSEFFPDKYKIDRDKWSENDRNMSHFFMKAYSNFAKYGNPTISQIRGLHFEQAQPGYLKYLNINTTYNSSILLNYRQIESAFWTNYLPTVIGRLLPIYPPITEYWLQSNTPVQIALWLLSIACLILLVVSCICSMLWQSAKSKTQAARHYADSQITTLTEIF